MEDQLPDDLPDEVFDGDLPADPPTAGEYPDGGFDGGFDGDYGADPAGTPWDDTLDLDTADSDPGDVDEPAGAGDLLAGDTDASLFGEDDHTGVSAEPDGPDDQPEGTELPEYEDVPAVGADSPAEFGADPDLPDTAAQADPGHWLDLPSLEHVEVPEPAGGRPWIDTDLLGDQTDGQPAGVGDGLPGDAAAPPAGAVDDLRAALGEPPPGAGTPTEAAYADLLDSDDPAVRALARHWGPPA